MKSLVDVLERAHGRIVGIGPDLNISTGYDSTEPGCDIEPDVWWDEEDRAMFAVSRSDRLILADMMIDRWTRYRAAIEALPPEQA